MNLKFIFIGILLVAILSRFYHLGTFPSGLTWDEAAIGYNAYGIVTNHRDEWLHRTPIVFRSFGDYKSPLLVYITAIPVALFGLTPFAVRLPVALAGVGLVIVSYFLTKEIFLQNLKKFNLSPLTLTLFPLFVMVLVALSPWAIHYSRIGFESMLAACLIAIGVFGWLRGFREQQKYWWVIGDVAFVLSPYAYHSAKIVVPLIALTLIVLYWKKFITHKNWLILGSIISILLLLPLLYATVFGKANDRATSTTVLGKPDAIVRFVTNYAKHLSPGFLLRGGDITYRHGTRETGVLYGGELILLVVGLIAIVSDKKLRKLAWVPAFFFVGIVPAALGLDGPHSNRALLALPWAQLTAGMGLLAIMHTIKGQKTWKVLHFIRSWTVLCAVVLLFLLQAIGYAKTYQRVYTSSVALKEMGYGYEEAIAYARSKEGEVSKVFFTNSYGQAYIYLLFFKGLTPIEYRGGGLANYTITDRPFEDASGQANVLVIGTPDQVPSHLNIVKEVKFPDGTIAFRIVKQ